MEDIHYLVSRFLFHGLGKESNLLDVSFLSGGCINMSVKATTDSSNFFIKWNELKLQDLFEKEIDGLETLRGKSSLVIPNVIHSGIIEGKIYAIFEYLEAGLSDGNAQKKLGEGLAELHSNTSRYFGHNTRNYIGKLAQNNDQTTSWIEFYREKRLRVQLGLALYEERVDSQFVDEFNRFLDQLDQLIPESVPRLLHGDLWNGNVLYSNQGPAIFDPAVYYGAPEMDLAMTELFGGFSKDFYDAYKSSGMLVQEYEELVDIYQLYPLMVHVNLFGADSGYLRPVKRIIARYL